ncbi:MAG: SGNH/GDSL hydrolase family protein [Pseudomonadota bacterium]
MRRRALIWKSAAFAALFASGAGAQSLPPVTVLGDSILAWNRNEDRSIADALSGILRRPVRDHAVSGAQLSGGAVFLREIRRQRVGPVPGWVVVDGGANDLMDACGCRSCATDLSTLAAPDGQSGEVPQFVDELLSRGHRVIWVGYYGPSGQGGAFDICDDELVELNRRLARMAGTRPAVAFVPTRDLFGRGNADRYDTDQIHPNAEGSQAIAARVAEVILVTEGG